MVGLERTVLPLLGRAGVRAQLQDRDPVLHRQLRGDESRRQPGRGPRLRSHRPQADPGRGLALRPASALPDHLRAGMVVDRPRQRAARREPGDGVVDDRHHEGRPRGPQAAWPGSRLQRVRRATSPSASCRGSPATSPRTTRCGRSRSIWGSPSPSSGSSSPSSSSGRRTATRSSKRRRRLSRRPGPHLAGSHLLRHEPRQREPLRGVPGGPGEQPQRRDVVGHLSPVLCGTWAGGAQIGVVKAVYPGVWGVLQLLLDRSPIASAARVSSRGG